MRKGMTTWTKRIVAALLALGMLLFGLPFTVEQSEAEVGNPYDMFPPLHGKWIEDNDDGTFDLNVAIGGERRYDANVVLVVDVSSSMKNNKMTDLNGNMTSAMTVLREVAKNFVNTLFADANNAANTHSEVNMAIVWYAGNAEILNMWTNDKQTLLNSCDKFNDSTTGLDANTNCQAGFFLANELYEKNTIAGQDTNRPTNLDTATNFILFMTDGAPNRAYVQSGTMSYTKLNDNYGVAASGSVNVDQLDYEAARPGVNYSSSRKRVQTYPTTGVIVSREIRSTDYRRFAADALLAEAERASKNPCNIRTASVGLGLWFTEDDADSEFPTAANLTRLTTLVGNGTITLEEARTQLGPDVGSGAMAGNNPPYPIIDTVDGVYKGDSYYDRFKSGSKYALDTNLTNLTLTQLKEWINLYYGSAQEQMQDGIYRLNPITRGGTTIDLVAESERYTYFGTTSQVFQHAFDNISRDLILTGYLMVRLSDMLSRNVQFADEIPQSELDRATIDPETGLLTIENPSFIKIKFYVHSHASGQGDWHDQFTTFEEHIQEYVPDPEPPDPSNYTTRYIRTTDDAVPDEYIELEFDERYLLRSDHAAIMTVRIKPTQYCIDTLYYNLNNPNFQAQSYAMSEMQTKTDGIDPAAVVNGVSPDTNGYPDEAFVMAYTFDEYGKCIYDENNTIVLDYREYDPNEDGLYQYGFFTNAHTQSDVDYIVTNLNSGDSDLVHVPIMMPVFQPKLVNVEVGKIWNEDSVVSHEPAYATVSWVQNIYGYTVTNSIKNEYVAGTQTLHKTVELSEDNNWHNTFVGLPQGHTFTLIESDADGNPVVQVYIDPNTNELRTYIPEWELCDDVVPESATISGTTFTIANPATSENLLSGIELFNQQTTDKTVTKVWEDNGNSNNRPDSVTVMLFRDGAPYREAVIPNPMTGADTWTYTFEFLPAYNTQGELSVYTVTETSDLNTKLDNNGNHITDYSCTTDQSTLTITNTDPGIKTDITASKVWDDNNNRDGIRPLSVDLSLYEDGVLVGTQTVSANTNWTCQWPDLPVYANNIRIVYDVRENATAGYTPVVTRNGSYFTVTNSHTPNTVTVPVTKAWSDMDNQDGVRPDEVEVQLVADGVPVNGKVITLSRVGGWTGSFTGVPENSNGTPIVYTVREITVVSGYTSVISGNAADGYVITNTHTPAYQDVTVNKVWNDGNSASRPASISVQLYMNNTAYGTPVVLNATNNWQYVFTDMPVRAAGNDIRYSVAETPVPTGYTVSYSGTSTSLTVTNTAYVSRTIKKVWSDDNNAEGNRPDCVWVQLLRNGENYSSPSRLSAETSWQFVWTKLPMYDEAGVLYTYTIEEVMYPELDTYYEPAYSSSGTTLTVTNKQDFADTLIVINKTWGSGEGEQTLFDAQFDVYCTTTQTVDGVTSTVGEHELIRTETLSWADSWSRTMKLPKWRIVDNTRYDYTYEVTENRVRLLSDSSLFTSFTNGKSSNDQYYSKSTRTGDVWDFTNYRPLATVGAQAHMIHKTIALDTAPLYTDGIRFAYDISVPALDAMLDPGDLFTFGYLVYPKHLLDRNAPSGTPTAATAQNYLMHLNITNHVWSSAFGESVVYCARAKDKSTTINANSTVTWTAQMEAAANAGNVDGLMTLLAAADCVIYEKIGTDSLRIVAHLMFSSSDPELRQRQADTVITYRGFLLMQRDGEDSVVYTMQRQNSATRVFNCYLYERFMPEYDTAADPDGYIGLGISDFYPVIDFQAMP